MHKPINGKPSASIVPPLAANDEGHDIAIIVEDVLDVLRRHDADANEGVVSLLTALVQAANRVLEASTPEETEHNRTALLTMFEHGRRFVDGWPQQTPNGWSVH
jgi:hypothetical protein